MKFRPQIQLRFRDEEQYAAAKQAATEVRSLNEWIVLLIERELKDGKGVRVPVGKVSRVTKSTRKEGPAVQDPDPFADPEFVPDPIPGRISGGSEPKRAEKSKAVVPAGLSNSEAQKWLREHK
jgi:hypothetical protein